MSLRNRLALSGGVAAAIFGIALAVAPGLLAGLSLGETAVTLLGGVALVYAAIPLYGRRNTERRQAPTPDPEQVPTVAPPGEDVDRLLAVAGSTTPHSADRRHRLRKRLEEAAVAAVRRREDCGVDEARRQLAEGTWTDDPVAAAYFTDGPVRIDDADLPLRRRLRLRLSKGTRRARAARRVADEVAALTGPEAPR